MDALITISESIYRTAAVNLEGHDESQIVCISYDLLYKYGISREISHGRIAQAFTAADRRSEVVKVIQALINERVFPDR